MAILAADDARGATPADLQTLVGGAVAADPAVRVAAVRGLGRLERPDMIGAILETLDDPDPDVRIAASFAAAQAVRATSGSPLVAAELERVAAEDPSAEVRGQAASDLGRLPRESPESAARTARLLATWLNDGLTGTPSSPLARGAARGLEVLLRRWATPHVGADSGFELPVNVRPALSLAAGSSSDTPTRRFAVAAFGPTGPPTPVTLEWLQTDPDPEVRRLAAATASRSELAAEMIDRALADEALTVRIEGWRQARRALTTRQRCDLARGRIAEIEPPESLEAIALLGQCPDATLLLERLAGGLGAGAEGGWHVSAAALLALAEVDPAAAGSHVRTAAAHPVREVRARAARTLGGLLTGDAGALDGDEARTLLVGLAGDPEAAVRIPALRALAESAPEQARAAALAALDRDEPELLMTAAGILERGGSAEAAAPLLAALERATARRAETLRDARLALLSAFGARAEEGLAERLRPYLRDFDAEVSASAAETYELLTGRPLEPAPEPLDRVTFPDRAELERIEGLEWVLAVRDRGVFVIRLWPWRAPTNAARFTRLAESGAFDGLTFHRVVANFVIQGLSPGANEYAGYPRYSRDEITPEPHQPGTVGLSTRGRDTGDGQIFVNLVANYRLDHEYTLFGEVVEGMEVVERILEADVVESVTARPTGR